MSAAFDYSDRQLRLHEFSFAAYGGQWAQRGMVTFDGPAEFRGEVSADEVAARELAGALAGREVKDGFETLRGEVNWDGRWAGPSWQETLSGSGRMHLEGGEVASSSVFSAIAKALLPWFDPLHLLKRWRHPTQLDYLSQSFELRDARLHTDDLLLVTGDYRLTARGSIGLDRSLDLDAEVAFTPNGLTRLLTVGGLPIPDVVHISLPPIPAVITGPLEHPTIIPDVPRIPGLSLRLLFEGIRDSVEAVGGAVDREIRSAE